MGGFLNSAKKPFEKKEIRKLRVKKSRRIYEKFKNNCFALKLFALDKDGTTIFHVKTTDFEGQKFQLVDHDTNQDITEQLLNAGFRSGDGGIVKYKFDNPDKPGKDRSPKTSYVLPFRRDGKEDFIVGSGFYLPDR